MPLEQELKSIYASLNSRTEEDFLASRGEYLAARLMAELARLRVCGRGGMAAL